MKSSKTLPVSVAVATLVIAIASCIAPMQWRGAVVEAAGCTSRIKRATLSELLANGICGSPTFWREALALVCSDTAIPVPGYSGRASLGSSTEYKVFDPWQMTPDRYWIDGTSAVPTPLVRTLDDIDDDTGPGELTLVLMYECRRAPREVWVDLNSAAQETASEALRSVLLDILLSNDGAVDPKTLTKCLTTSRIREGAAVHVANLPWREAANTVLPLMNSANDTAVDSAVWIVGTKALREDAGELDSDIAGDLACRLAQLASGGNKKALWALSNLPVEVSTDGATRCGNWDSRVKLAALVPSVSYVKRLNRSTLVEAVEARDDIELAGCAIAVLAKIGAKEQVTGWAMGSQNDAVRAAALLQLREWLNDDMNVLRLVLSVAADVSKPSIDRLAALRAWSERRAPEASEVDVVRMVASENGGLASFEAMDALETVQGKR